MTDKHRIERKVDKNRVVRKLPVKQAEPGETKAKQVNQPSKNHPPQPIRYSEWQQ